jgi:hypothetical protein
MEDRAWRFPRVGKNEVPLEREGLSMWDVLYSEYFQYTPRCQQSRQANQKSR